VTEHSLAPGKRWIANLLRLGRTLGYDVDDEFNVAQPGEEEAPVDVVWLRSAEDRFPLFIFEVETRPSGQMTYNAGKVFAQDTDLFEKPLFHFHVVLTGGATSGRLKAATDLFGRFNYRVYRAASPDGATTALCDILSQHRRVTETLSVTSLADALDPERWSEIDLDTVWEHVERCQFAGSFETDYARLSATDEAFLPRLVRRLRREIDGQQIDPRQYESPLARNCSPLLHAAILALMDPALATDALTLATDWQGTGSHARIAPPEQQSELQENLAYAYAPAMWAALAGALATEPAHHWALAQLELVLGDPGRPTPLAMSACAAVWMLHVARSGGEPHRDAYERAANHLKALGGIPSDLLHSPPGTGGLMNSIDAWEARLQSNPEPPPDWDALPAQPQTAACHDALQAVLVSVIAGPAAELDGGAVQRALWHSHGG
jgi:hypothetical protein